MITDHRFVALAQAFTPQAAVVTLLAALVLAITGAWIAAGVLVLIGLLLGLRVVPAMRRAAVHAAARPRLTVLHANVLFRNRVDLHRVADVVLGSEAEVLVICEMTARLRAVLESHSSANRYPHRVGEDGRRAEGIAVWSRRPLVDVLVEPLGGRHAITATVRDADGTPTRVMAVHAPTPTDRVHGPQWAAVLRTIATLASTRSVSLVVGDFNATRWHAPFRAILRAGFRDAHELAGRGLSASWPIGGRVVPPTMRLDHALLGPTVELISLDDLSVPGSDHRGFVVSVGDAAP